MFKKIIGALLIAFPLMSLFSMLMSGKLLPQPGVEVPRYIGFVLGYFFMGAIMVNYGVKLFQNKPKDK